jgi:protocatechuate 3,4-dioxygenase beta subunit
MRLTTVIVLLALITPAAVAQQRDAVPATLTLRGVVLSGNDVPLARVRVAVTPGSVTEPAVLTDDRGQFTVRVPDTESVRLTFSKARYVGTSIEVPRSAPNTTDRADIRVRLSLGGAINGQVRDRSGAPVIEATVTARRLVPSPSTTDPSLFTATTNDLGDFRIGGLVAGAYAVAVRLPPQFNSPQAAPVEEQTVNVGLGADVGGIDAIVDVPSELSGSSGPRPKDPEASASLRGRVVTSRGTPIAGAVVQAYGPGSDAVATAPAETDARGRFALDQLVPGDYRVRAFKRGYIATTPGQGRSAIDYLLTDGPREGRLITVGRGQTVESIELLLGRGASIAGTVVDEFGEPMQDVAVNVLELRVVAGRTRALRVSSSRGVNGRTDDRGRYRLYGLHPGNYIVQATAGNMLSTTTGYVPIFYPGTPTIDFAVATKLDADASVAGVDLSLIPQPTRRIRGIVLTPLGTPARPATLTMSRRSSAVQEDAVRTGTSPDGTFAFNNVQPGEYIVQATTTDRTPGSAVVAVARQFAEAVVTVGSDDPSPVQLRLSPGATLMGRVVFEGIASPPAYSGVELTTIPAEFNGDSLMGGASAAGFILLADNSFEYRGIFGRSLLIAQPKDPSWYVKSITYRGQDLADTPFDFGTTEIFRDIEVVVSAGGAAVAGRAIDDRAAPVRDYTVALIPTDRSKLTVRSRWLKTGRPNQDGSFRLTGVVPGEYWAVAVDRLDGSEVAGDLQNPDVLDALASRAVRISLGEGQSQDLTLRLVRR